MDKKNASVYSGIYGEVVEIIGDDKLKRFYRYFRGQQVVFPMKLYSKEYVVNEMLRSNGEKSLAEFAKEFDYSERYLRKLLQKKKEEIQKDADEMGEVS